MALSAAVEFGPYRLDPHTAQLRRGGEPIPLPPKAFALLAFLCEQRGRLVSKDELLDAVWGRRFVSEGVLKNAVQALRQALEDDTKAPRYIETAHRRGYRFIAELRSGAPAADPDPPLFAMPAASEALSIVVGREAAIGRLLQSTEQALHGDPQIVFVTGEAGAGKTALIEACTGRIDPRFSCARGQCVEQFGQGEPYLPILEALNAVCRAAGEGCVNGVRQYAPTWLTQLPWFLGEADRVQLQREVLGATKERMLREIGEWLERYTAERALLLVLEDLHWSDVATLDLIAYLARRRAGRWVIVASYRPVELGSTDHPLQGVKRELELHGRCRELRLDLLPESAVAAYLARRHPDRAFPEALVQAIHRRTEGLPLYLVHLVEELNRESSDSGSLEERFERLAPLMPAGLEDLIERQLARLSPEQQQVLEVASVPGVSFCADLVAVGTGRWAADIEASCEGLCRRQQFLMPQSPVRSPERRRAARYRFTHGYYREIAYARLSLARRADLHRLAGEWFETVAGGRVQALAAELARDFEQGRDYQKAVAYLKRAAGNATRRCADREAIGYLRHAAELVPCLPEAEHARRTVLELLGCSARSMGDLGSAIETFEALAESARAEGETAAEVRALLYLASVLFLGESERCLEVASLATALSETTGDTGLRARARAQHAGHYLGWKPWEEAVFHDWTGAMEEMRGAGDREGLGQHIGYYALSHCHRSAYRAARDLAAEGMVLTEEAGDGFQYVVCQYALARALLFLGDWGRLIEVLDDGERRTERNGHRYGQMFFRLLRAWLHIQVFSFAEAARLSQTVCALAHDSPDLRYPLFLGLLLDGMALLGAGRSGEASQRFAEIQDRLERGERMYWNLHLPLSQGLAECALAEGDLEAARAQAERLCEMAGRPRERGYLAAGHALLAELALCAGEQGRAQGAIERALAVLDGAEAPLAAWRIQALAARIHEHRGAKARARQSWSQSAEIIVRLADSVGTHPALRDSFLAAPPVCAVLSRCGLKDATASGGKAAARRAAP